MALKDWKKTYDKNDSIEYENKKGLWIQISKTLYGEYRVVTKTDIYNPRKFRTKSQAIAYAKRYMRTH